MNWLPIKEVAKRSGKAERTLRLYASQGRVKAKKEGKEWLLEIASLKNVKIILAEPTAKVAAMSNVAAKNNAKSAATARVSGNFAESKSHSAKVNDRKSYSPSEKQNLRQTAKITNDDSAKSGNGKKYKTLSDLGVYKDLVDLWHENQFKESDDIAHLLRHSIEQVAIGFYEYHAERKATHFRNAREAVVKAIAGITIERNQKLSPLCESLENEIVPGLIGLIKRYEKIKK